MRNCFQTTRVELMRALGALDPADWAETTLDYEVQK